MAPTTQIETVYVVRPLKVLACICGVISIILCIVAIASTAWLEADGYRQGLWEECWWSQTVAYNCRANPAEAWIQACAGLCICSLLIDFIAVCFNAGGLFMKDPKRKFQLYRAAMYIMFFAVICIVVALIVFPACFVSRMGEKDPPKEEWYFAWAYGVGWGCAIFQFGAAILLLIDKESEEIYYKEKTYYDNQSDA